MRHRCILTALIAFAVCCGAPLPASAQSTPAYSPAPYGQQPYGQPSPYGQQPYGQAQYPQPGAPPVPGQQAPYYTPPPGDPAQYMNTPGYTPKNPLLMGLVVAPILQVAGGALANGIGTVSYTHLTLPTNREV